MNRGIQIGVGLKVLFVCGIVALLVAPLQAAEAQRATEDARPNVLFILTDDQSRLDAENMESLRSLVSSRGAKMSRAYATTPQCCPSRASFLTGKYTKNHGVLSNVKPYAWDAFRDSGGDKSTVATWLNDAGYRVGYAGKYMNNYGGQQNATTTTYVPPGYDAWWGWQGGRRDYGREFKINANGEIKSYNATNLHETDYLSDRAEGFVRNSEGRKAPWFFTLATNAPHTPHEALGRHAGEHAGDTMPLPPSYQEEDVSDKPAWVETAAERMPPEEHEGQWRNKMDDQEFIDDAIEDLTTALAETGQSDETYIIYAGDNGCANYANRVYCKGAPYEPSIGIPMSIAGPGIEPQENPALVGNIDVAPTIADWADASVPADVDGRSMAPILENPGADWRSSLMVDFYSAHPYKGLLTSDGKRYFEYETGEREYYDLDEDPWQLQNSYNTLQPEQRDQLSRRLEALRNCSGNTCREADNQPEPADERSRRPAG